MIATFEAPLASEMNRGAESFLAKIASAGPVDNSAGVVQSALSAVNGPESPVADMKAIIDEWIVPVLVAMFIAENDLDKNK